MKKDLYIFGASTYALVAKFYFELDSDYSFVKFVVDKDRPIAKEIEKDHIILTEDFLKIENKEEIYLYIAIGFSQINAAREEKYKFFKNKNYKFATYISKRAIVYDRNLIGEHCFILENNIIQPYAKIKNNSILWSGNHIGHHVNISDNVFISSHCVLSGGVTISKNSFLGVNSCFAENVVVGENCVIGMGATVSRDIPTNSIVKSPKCEISPVSSLRLDF